MGRYPESVLWIGKDRRIGSSKGGLLSGGNGKIRGETFAEESEGIGHDEGGGCIAWQAAGRPANSIRM